MPTEKERSVPGQCPDCGQQIFKSTPHVCPANPKPVSMSDLHDILVEIRDYLKEKGRV